MDLEPGERVLIRTLADRGSATYVSLIKAMGQPLTPASPAIVRKAAVRPLQLGFIRKAGLFRGRYAITPSGREWIDARGTNADEGGELGASAAQDPMPGAEAEDRPRLSKPWIGGVGAGGLLGFVVLLAARPAPMEFLAGTGILVLVGVAILGFSLLPGETRLRVGFGGAYALLALSSITVLVMTAVGAFPITIAVLLIPVLALVVAALVVLRRGVQRRTVLEALGEEAGFGQVDMPREKSPLIAYIFWLVPPLGMLGMHRYYLGRHLSGLLYTCTMSLFMFGWIVDALLIPRLTRSSNQRVWEAWFADAHWPATTAAGTARDVKLTTVQAGDYPGAIATKQVLNFRVELVDASGDIDRLVPVELVGNAITGSLRDGDDVSVRGKLSGEGILRALAVDNDTTNSRLVVRF